MLLMICNIALLGIEEHFKDFLDVDQSAEGSLSYLMGVEPLHGAQQCRCRSSRSF